MKVPNYKAFYRTGMLIEEAALAHRAEAERSLVDEMRLRGYVPVLGLGPYYSQQYDFTGNRRVFHLTMHGAFVGKEYEKEIEGVDAFTGQRVMKTTRPAK